jgi:hypothetical protein
MSAGSNTDFYNIQYSTACRGSLTKSLLTGNVEKPKSCSCQKLIYDGTGIQTFKLSAVITSSSSMVLMSSSQALSYLEQMAVSGHLRCHAELFIELYNLLEAGNINSATKLQFSINAIIEKCVPVMATCTLL